MSDTTGIPNTSICQWCNQYHGAKCPLVKAIEYENGVVKRVEFFDASGTDTRSPALTHDEGASYLRRYYASRG